MLEILRRNSCSLAPNQRKKELPRIPHASGNLVVDIIRFSGLSDQEISQALRLEPGQVPALYCSLNGQNPARLKEIRQFHTANIILAAVFRAEQVAQWWRSGEEGETMLDYWMDRRREKVLTEVRRFVK